jgi:DNA-binding transcriptional MerR regulator
MRTLTTGDVLEIAGPDGLTPKELRLWCEQGLVNPIEGGDGHGSHRRFSVMQTVGIVVATKVRRSEQGCVPAYVGKVVAAFARMKEAELKKLIAKNGPCLVTIHEGRPLLRGAQFDWVDVEDVYDRVNKAIAEIEERLKYAVGGRPRGLAGAIKR